MHPKIASVTHCSDAPATLASEASALVLPQNTQAGRCAIENAQCHLIQALCFMNNQYDQPDETLTPEQLKRVERLSEAEIETIDNALLANTSLQWRKVARVVMTTMNELPCRVVGIPDSYYSQRIQQLVNAGLLESQGNLSYMRYSEVRRPASNET